MSTTPYLEVITFNGSYHTLIDKVGARYDTITFSEIVHRASAPTAHLKKHAPAIIPSSYCEHDARVHLVQRQKGLFHLLCADIDKGSPSLGGVRAAVQGVLGQTSLVIYSTASSSADNMKWRVIAPLAAPLPGADYTPTASAFFDLLAQHGIECDRSLDRTGQPVYLPNVPADRRDNAMPGSPPLFYQFEIIDGPPLDLTATRIPERQAAVAEVEETRDREARAAAERRHADRAASVIPSDTSLIDIYNANNDLTEVLGRYDYRYDGNDNWRSPLQQGSSFATKVYGNKWFSLSTSDGDVGAAARSGGRFGDAFDLYVYYQHAGDKAAAFRELGLEQRASTAAEKWAARRGTMDDGGEEGEHFSSDPDCKASNIDAEDECPPFEDEENANIPIAPVTPRSGSLPFEESLKALIEDPGNKEKITEAVMQFAKLGPVDKILEEERLSKAAGLTKSALRSMGAEMAKLQNGPSDLTHSEMADILLKEYHKKADVPVGNAGALFFYDQIGLWRKKNLEEMRVLIGRRYREQDNAKRNSDYGGIANLVYQSVLDEEFFTSAAPGICTVKGFWKVAGSDVVLVPHSKENRARFQLKVEPDFTSEPSLFLSVLDEAFFDLEDESQGEDQKRLVRQMFGAAIFGVQQNLQRAVFLYGASGSGKSVVLRVLEALFDPQDVTVVSPHELDQDYKKATLSHKRLNIVPELEPDKPIPSAAFKAALGEDRLNARLP